MPASKVNYLVVYQNESQVFGTATESIALESPPPDGTPLEEKRVFFITYQPDNEQMLLHKLPQDKILNADIKYKKKKKEEK